MGADQPAEQRFSLACTRQPRSRLQDGELSRRSAASRMPEMQGVTAATEGDRGGRAISGRFDL